MSSFPPQRWHPNNTALSRGHPFPLIYPDIKHSPTRVDIRGWNYNKLHFVLTIEVNIPLELLMYIYIYIYIIYIYIQNLVNTKHGMWIYIYYIYSHIVDYYLFSQQYPWISIRDWDDVSRCWHWPRKLQRRAACAAHLEVGHPSASTLVIYKG